MEDGPNQTTLAFRSPPQLSPQAAVFNKGDVGMANFPTLESAASPTKVNGESAYLPESENENEKSNSDCDNLVIDESVASNFEPPPPPSPREKRRRSDDDDDDDQAYHSNPYFAKSIFELTNHFGGKASVNAGNHSEEEEVADEAGGIPKLSLRKVGGRYAKKPRKNGKPKLREYAQYLGLQPTVQFKCSKCGVAGFESLLLLNEHYNNCTAVAPLTPQPPVASSNSTNFKVTRKVFLCSACGTYYENYNLFLHIREVHKRYICLYCLGMFPNAEKLSAHLVSKHNCAPQRHDTARDFLDAVKDQSCFLMCCECHVVFNEQENFTQHVCVAGRRTGKGSRATECPAQGSEVQDEVQVTSNQVVFEANPTENEISVLLSADKTISDNISESDKLVSDTHSKSRSKYDEGANTQDELEDEETMNDSGDDAQPPTLSPQLPGEDNRKVPKVTLKLKLSAFSAEENDEEEADEEKQEENDNEDEEYQSDDSEKPSMELDKTSETHEDKNESITELGEEENVDVDVTGHDGDHVLNDTTVFEDSVAAEEEGVKDPVFPTAGMDVSINEIELEQPLDKIEIKELLRKCLRSTIPTCLYCNHARKIFVNGKQLGMHAIAEHRYSSIVKSITAEELIPESFNTRILECAEELDQMYFNLEENPETEGVSFTHVFECFQCRYSSAVHKELYVHNRKMHAKALLLCTMCKTSFYSYSELICHLCPGVYSSGRDVQFHCCLCASGDLPSAFRLMVHLRKKHHVCDVCLEMCHNQTRLSSHVWKHKLHHLCYRCGIAYRNKPDITKHLFWKHGTESVECKRCLQKKWPHMYHFCVPPPSFTCEECSLSFTRASRLMVHKRLHAELYPHVCTEEGCSEKFISKKLLSKHEARHRGIVEEPKEEEEEEEEIVVQEFVPNERMEVKITDNEKTGEEVKEEKEEKPKPKVDVYDLPELNLSESDTSDSEDESSKSAKKIKPDAQTEELMEMSRDILEMPEALAAMSNDLPQFDNPISEPTPVLDIWDNFKNYQANIAKNILSDVGKPEDDLPDILTDIPPVLTLEIALHDHDYCPRTTDTLNEQEGIPGAILETPIPKTSPEKSKDHDYCTESQVKEVATPNSIPIEARVNNSQAKPNEKPDSNASSDSDSSSCTCGSNCSCSSSSDSSSSSSDSSESDSSSEEGRRKQQVRREKRRGRKPKQEAPNAANAKTTAQQSQNTAEAAKEEKVLPVMPKEVPIQESDLDTTEPDTDEDFYDREPQKLANKLLAEKREKLLQMAELGPYINGSMIDSRSTTPNLVEEQPQQQQRSRKKSKSKKKKKKKKRSESKHASVSSYHHHPTVAPLTLTIPKISPSVTPAYNSPLINNHVNVNNMSMTMGMVQTPATQSAPQSEGESGTRASKRRRVPNKFYGYSSDEEAEKPAQTPIKFRKVDPPPKPALTVPPITIKTSNHTPTVDPISIRMSAKTNEMRVQPLRLLFPKRNRAPPKPRGRRPPPAPTLPRFVPPVLDDNDSDTDSNTSSDDDEPPPPRTSHMHHMPPPPKPNQPALYCYCRCPYDEVSEMIGCDSDDCNIEWFHFECVGIMVPPKGQWFCPDCRKKKQQRREMLQQQMQQQQQLAQEN